MMTGASLIRGRSSSKMKAEAILLQEDGPALAAEAVLAKEVVLLRQRGQAVTTEAMRATEVLLW